MAWGGGAARGGGLRWGWGWCSRPASCSSSWPGNFLAQLSGPRQGWRRRSRRHPTPEQDSPLEQEQGHRWGSGRGRGEPCLQPGAEVVFGAAAHLELARAPQHCQGLHRPGPVGLGQAARRLVGPAVPRGLVSGPTVAAGPSVGQADLLPPRAGKQSARWGCPSRLCWPSRKWGAGAWARWPTLG